MSCKFHYLVGLLILNEQAEKEIIWLHDYHRVKSEIFCTWHARAEGQKKKARFDYDVLAQKSLLVALKFGMKLSHPWGLSVF